MYSSPQTARRIFPGLEYLSVGRVAFAIGLIIVLSGGVSNGDLQQIGLTVALPLLSLLGLSIIALSVHEVGVFALAANLVARISGGSGKRLFTNLYLLCAGITVLFPNDATILLFTPLVLRTLLIIQTPEWKAQNAVPFLLAIVFGANAASIALVTSNPINMIFSAHFGLAYLDYAGWMFLPAVASSVVCYGLLRWACRKDIPNRYEQAPHKITDSPTGNDGDLSQSSISTPNQLQSPTHSTDKAPFWVATSVALAMFVSYFLLSALGIAYHWAILAGSLVILWPVLASPDASLRRVFSGLPWDELLFVTGMFVIAVGLTNGGLTQLLEMAVIWLTQSSLLVTALGNSFLTMIGANLINDWPMALLSSLAIDQVANTTAVSGTTRDVLAYTAVLSANLGNKILPVGSLATLIWMGVIWRIAGIQIRWGYFIRIGLIVTPLTLLAATLTLWLEFYLWG